MDGRGISLRRADGATLRGMDDPAHPIGTAVYAEARLSSAEPTPGGAFTIALRLGLRVHELPRVAGEADTACVRGVDRIVIASGLEIGRQNFLVARMVARLWLRGVVASPDERAAIELPAAAWLAAPPIAFAARYLQVHEDVRALAGPFAITRTAALLRLHEVVGSEVAVVGEHAVYRRGRRFAWLDDAALRGLVAKRSTRSVRRVQLREDGRAVGLLVVA